MKTLSHISFKVTELIDYFGAKLQFSIALLFLSSSLCFLGP